MYRMQYMRHMHIQAQQHHPGHVQHPGHPPPQMQGPPRHGPPVQGHPPMQQVVNQPASGPPQQTPPPSAQHAPVAQGDFGIKFFVLLKYLKHLTNTKLHFKFLLENKLTKQY